VCSNVSLTNSTDSISIRKTARGNNLQNVYCRGVICGHSRENIIGAGFGGSSQCRASPRFWTILSFRIMHPTVRVTCVCQLAMRYRTIRMKPVPRKDSTGVFYGSEGGYRLMSLASYSANLGLRPPAGAKTAVIVVVTELNHWGPPRDVAGATGPRPAVPPLDRRKYRFGASVLSPKPARLLKGTGLCTDRNHLKEMGERLTETACSWSLKGYWLLPA
jgi:hypothetical protein